MMYWSIESWGADYPPENADEIINRANELIDLYAETHDEAETAEYSDRLWDIYTTHGRFPEGVTRTWKVYGAEGHRQRESFHKSRHWDFSCPKTPVRIIDVLNADVTGTNEYTIVRITRNTAEECERELDGQLSDGLFEDSRYGKVEEVL